MLLRGAPGAGKSDLALRLIEGGAQLVADDQVALTSSGGALLAAPPARIAGLLEVRGIGIVSMEFMPQCPVRLVVDLAAPHAIERMPGGRKHYSCRPSGAARGACSVRDVDAGKGEACARRRRTGHAAARSAG